MTPTAAVNVSSLQDSYTSVMFAYVMVYISNSDKVSNTEILIFIYPAELHMLCRCQTDPPKRFLNAFMYTFNEVQIKAATGKLFFFSHLLAELP